MKIPIRASQNKQRGHMRPAGRQFDMSAIEGGGRQIVTGNYFII